MHSNRRINIPQLYRVVRTKLFLYTHRLRNSTNKYGRDSNNNTLSANVNS